MGKHCNRLKALTADIARFAQRKNWTDCNPRCGIPPLFGFTLLFLLVRPDLVVELIDVSTAHGKHEVAGLPMLAQVCLRIIKGGGEYGVDAMLLHALDDLYGLDVAGVFFTGGIDICDQRYIRVGGAGEVIAKQALDSAVGMRLHDGPKAVVRL